MFKIQKKKNLSVWVPSFLTAKSWAYTNTSFSLPYPSFNPSSLLSVLKIKSPLGRKLRESFYSLSEKMATHSNILAWKIPWIEEPGGLQSTGSQRVGHDSATLICFAVRNRFLHRLSCGYQSIRLKLFRTFLLIPLNSSHIPPLPRTYS